MSDSVMGSPNKMTCNDCGQDKECRFTNYKDSPGPILICLKCHYKRNVTNRFMFHSASDEQQQRLYTDNREACCELALQFVNNCPVSMELDEALKRLDEVMFWANAAIARNS